MVGLPHQGGETFVHRRRIQDDERFAPNLFEHPGNLRNHLFGSFEHGRVMLQEDNRVARILQDDEELVCGERTADLEVLGGPGNRGEDTGVVPADVKEEKALQVRVAVDGWDDDLLRCYDGVEGPRVEGHPFAELDEHRPGSLLH